MVGSVSSYGKDIVRRVREDSLLWLAFAALLAWMFGLYWSDTLLGLFSLGQLDLLEMRASWLGAEAVALLAALLAAARLLERRAIVVLVAGTSVFAGTVAVLFGPSIAPSDAIRSVGVALTGVGSAGLLLMLGVALARKGAKALLIDVALALLVASLLDSAMLLTSSAARQLVIALLPALSSALLVLALRKDEAKPLPAEGKGAPARINTVRIVALPAIVGLAYGLMQRLAEGSFAMGDGSGNVATIVSFVLSALVIALAALFLDSRKLIKVVCFAAIPVIGIAFVMLPLFAGSREAIQGVCIVGFNSFYFMVWALWSDGREGAELPKRFTLGLFVLVAAECLGSLAGAFVVEAIEGSGATLAVVSLVVVYLLLMAGIFSFDRSTRAVPLPDASPVERVLDDADSWAARFGLSAREQEVFEMLARGRNRAYISKTLVVSDNTTRTHMKNVYRKLGVHSQQELIDLVENRQAGKGKLW